MQLCETFGDRSTHKGNVCIVLELSLDSVDWPWIPEGPKLDMLLVNATI
jgi:hypothetical protein